VPDVVFGVGHGTINTVPTPAKSVREILDQNAELTARLRVAEYIQVERARLEAENQKLRQENGRLSERAVLLEEELRWLRAQIFGRSSEKSSSDVSADQQMLFNEAEVLALIAAADAAHANRTTKIEAHERKHTGGRKAIPENFPRIPIEHDLPESEKVCTMCATPHPLTRMGEETCERYRYEAPKITVEQHIRPKYVCDIRNEGVKIAPPPPTLLPKSKASPSLLAHLITSKFVDGLPLYRISRQLERSGMDLSPGTAGTWVNIVGGDKVVPLINLLNEGLLEALFVHMDETYLQVLKSDKAVNSTHYMVVRAGGPPGRRIILYNYEASRTTEALKNLLIGPNGPYTGKLITDGLDLYDGVCASLKLLHFGCLQHLRAYFRKAQKVSELASSRSLARVAVEDYIGKVYAVEREIKKLEEEHEGRGETLPLEVVLKLRQDKSAPIMAAFKKWVDDLLPGVPPKSALGKALAYTTSQWSKVCLFLTHPEIPADNNYCEQQIRNFVIGRKAWVFCDSKVGATASANLYSLVMSARANEVEPFEYLTYVFEHLPTATTVEELEALLPWNVKAVLQKRKEEKQAQERREQEKTAVA
jgi:transposase